MFINKISRFAAPVVLVSLVFSGLAFADDPAPTVKAPQVSDPARVLFVGNSYLYYNDSLHNHVRRMAMAAGLAEESQYKSATIGGARLR